MSISDHTLRRLDLGEARSATIGEPAVRVWSSHFGNHGAAGSSQMLVVFDRRDAKDPQPVACNMRLPHDQADGLEAHALRLLRGSRRQADGRTSCVHDFRGPLKGHRLVIVGTGNVPEGLLSKMLQKCAAGALVNRDRLAA